MTSVSDSHPAMQPPLQIDRVEWLPSSSDAVLVRVLGQRHGTLGEQPPLLLIDDGDQGQAFEAEPAEPSVSESSEQEPQNAAWAATFSVPIELRPRLESGLALKLGDLQIDLPAAVPGAEPGLESPSAPGRVIDREVLAERRARRAELNEQALMSRAAAGEATIRTLRSQLGNLEQRLEQTAQEREQLATALSQRERDLRAAKQREYAEEQLRFEAEEQRRAAELQASSGVAELRQLLHEAEREVARLNGELETVRRQLAEAQHAAAADQASLSRLRRELEERQTELVRREAELSQHEQEVSAELDRGQAARAEVQQRQAELEQRAQELESRMAELHGELTAEQARREMLEHELSVRPEPGSDERANALQVELERRALLQAQVAGELSLLHGELEQVRASAEHQRERNDEADRLLEELGRTIGGLRVELEGLERDKHAAEATAEQLRNEVGELVRALELARTEPRRDDSQVLLLREQVELRDQQLREAERTIHALGQSASELRAELQAERDRHAGTAAELRARMEEERQAAERRLASAEARMREQLTAQGERLILQADSTQESSQRLSEQLREATERAAERERELSQAQAAVVAAREQAATVGQREADLERMVSELSGTAAELREGFERELATMQQQLAEQVAGERDRYMRELGAMEGRVDELRQQLAQAAGGLQSELESEQSARRHAETQLAEERLAVMRLNEELRALRAQSEAAAQPSSDAGSAPALGAPPADVQSPVEVAKAPPADVAPAPDSAETLAEQRRQEMADALAEAVQRLRSRVAARPECEGEEPNAGEQQPLEESPVVEQPPAPVSADLVAEAPVPASTEFGTPMGDGSEALAAPEQPDVAASGPPLSPAAEPASAPELSQDQDPATVEPAAPEHQRRRRRLRLFGARRGAQPRTGPPLQAQPAANPPRHEPAGGDTPPPGPPLPLTLEAPTDARELSVSDWSADPGAPSAWLAPALQRVASERDAQLAADLIVELLPAQGLHLDRPTSYGLQIAGGELYVVRGGGHRPANVSRALAGDRPSLEFTLSGSPDALSALIAAGGLRRLPGVEVNGRRRRARRVIRARPTPLTLAEVAQAGISVWPGLLLLVLAEGIDPSWTDGERFVLAWAIQETPGALLYAVVNDGQPVGVTHRAPAPPAVAVYLSERAFLSLMSGTPVDEQQRILVSGDEQSAHRFIAWAHRAQGITAAPTD